MTTEGTAARRPGRSPGPDRPPSYDFFTLPCRFVDGGREDSSHGRSHRRVESSSGKSSCSEHVGTNEDQWVLCQAGRRGENEEHE
jgi:hypothetical protein